MDTNRLFCWYLEDPKTPRIVGEVRLEANARTCILLLDPEWQRSGFDLIPDMSSRQRLHVPRGDERAPGVLDDAMPDRWGERVNLPGLNPGASLPSAAALSLRPRLKVFVTSLAVQPKPPVSA